MFGSSEQSFDNHAGYVFVVVPRLLPDFSRRRRKVVTPPGHDNLNYFFLLLSTVYKKAWLISVGVCFTLVARSYLCQQNDSPKAPGSMAPSPMVPRPPRGRKNPPEIRLNTAVPPATPSSLLARIPKTSSEWSKSTTPCTNRSPWRSRTWSPR